MRCAEIHSADGGERNNEFSGNRLDRLCLGIWRRALWIISSFRAAEPHVSAESKDAVKLGIGLIATMTALVLGLLVSTAKSSFDTKHNELTQMSPTPSCLIGCSLAMARRPRPFGNCCAGRVNDPLR